MKLIASTLVPMIRGAVREGVGIAGVALVLTGIRQIYAPASLIVAGVAFVYAAVVMARRS